MAKPATAADGRTAWRQDQALGFGWEVEIKRGDDRVIACGSGFQSQIIVAVEDIKVIPRTTGHGIGILAADEGIIARTTLEHIPPCIAGQNIRLIAAGQDVILFATFKRIGSITAFKRICAIASQKLIGVSVADQAIMAKPATAADGRAVWCQDQDLDFGWQVEINRGDDRVIAFEIGFHYQTIGGLEDIKIIPRTTGHDVKTGAAGQAVIAHACPQYVVACIAVQAIMPRTANQVVAFRSPHQGDASDGCACINSFEFCDPCAAERLVL